MKGMLKMRLLVLPSSFFHALSKFNRRDKSVTTMFIIMASGCLK